MVKHATVDSNLNQVMDHSTLAISDGQRLEQSFKGVDAHIPPKPVRPTPTRFEWRPRVRQTKTAGNPRPLNPSGSDPPQIFSTEPTQIPIVPSHDSVVVFEPPASADTINRTWGSLSSWMLELQDGLRLSIPLFDSYDADKHQGSWKRGFRVASID